MGLQFILGASGTGKTTRCLAEIDAFLTQYAADAHAPPLYYLVPEQFSLQAERLILTNRNATMRVQVLSFNRLAFRLFSALGGPPGRVADELAKAMLLRKVLFENADALKYYQSAYDKQGFVEALAHTVTELNHYRITAQNLRDRARNVPDAEGDALAAKLYDLALITEKYRAAVNGQYLLTDDMLELLIQRLQAHAGTLPLLDNAHMYADGFSGFTPQERQVLVQLMHRAKHVTITLTTRDTPIVTDPLCAAPRATQERLMHEATQAGIPVLPPVHMKENFRHAHNKRLAFFVENYAILLKDVKSFNAPPNGSAPATNETQIEIIPASDPYAAVLAAASRIQAWRHKNGYRFRDIAILCGDRSRYEKTLRTVFDQMQIPLFVDTETDILSHPLTELIRAAFDIVNRNFNYESVFRFLKTGLTGIAQNNVDMLENYALAHGISGYRWQYEMAHPMAEAARITFMNALKNFCKAGKKETVTGFSRRTFDLLYTLNVPDTLASRFAAYIKAGDPDTARMHKQIWPKICEVFDKLVEILGETKVTPQEFAALLDTGFSQIGLGRIPPTLEQVVLGDTGRSRYPAIRAMLVLGANEGALPPAPTAPGLFTDDEREKLRNTALELAPDLIDAVNEQFYALYCALSQPADALAFIYAEGELSGTPLRPSPVLRTVNALFPDIKPTPYIPVQAHAPSPSLAGAGTLPHAPAPQLMRDVYGTTLHTAASRLEAYARCPFAYYLTYLLTAKPRKQYEVLPTDLGILFHDVVARYALQHKWLPRSRSEIDAIVTELVQEITPENAALRGSARNRHVLEKARRVCTASIWALTEQMKDNAYAPAFAEIDLPETAPIPLDNGKKLSLTGRIDRVDLHEAEDGNTYVQIIDYKSGNARFRGEEIQNGTQLQLILYLNAMLKSPEIKNPRAGGIFYFPISDPLVKTDILLEEPVREAALLKQFKPSGIVPDEKNAAYFAFLSQAADAKIKQLATQLTDGNIAPAPCPKGGVLPCEYCNFTAICKRQFNEK
ncbi:MAG: PD-(D/E)XK nuclease family protein [Defluviitaleaceae bacterium]|nr:PD-(D/E)XK nuclease family protein [Defluviitaleaceae bacterium]MCL2275639.1 PD-(D/E)XK nuclease family protein [Defluviitaleaceae bacterium]